MPLRFFENGLHDADGSAGSIAASVCSASQAFSEPNDERCLGAAGQRQIELAGRDAPPGLADRDRRRRAGGGIRQVRPAQPMFDADPAGRRVVHAHQDRVRLDPVRRLAVQRPVAFVAGLRARHPGADEDAGATAIEAAQWIGGALERLPGADQRELADAIEHAQLWRLEVGGAVEPRGRGKRGDEAMAERRLEAMHAGSPGHCIGEDLCQRVAERRHDADAADGDPRHEPREAGSTAASAGATAPRCATTSRSM